MDKTERETPSHDLAELAQDLRVLVPRLRNRMREEAGEGDITWSQRSVLVHILKHGSATVSELARLEGIKPQSMGATISALEAAGYVQGAPDPQDGRKTLISATEFALQWLARNRAAREGWLARVIAAEFTEDEQRQLAAVIPLLRRIASS